MSYPGRAVYSPCPTPPLPLPSPPPPPAEAQAAPEAPAAPAVPLPSPCPQTEDGKSFVPVPWKPNMDDPNIISKQWGAEVRLDCGDVLKRGYRVTKNEEAALRIVKEHTTIPVPEVYSSQYAIIRGQMWGQIWMEHLPGRPLNELWDELEGPTKERICNEVWGFVQQLRNIPKPPELEQFYQCGADGSASMDVLLDDLNYPPSPIWDDDSLVTRINERYLYCNGGSYGENLLDYLPRSNLASVFTHADLAPRNILVDESCNITGLVDWESAGWYPEYWEYAKTQVQWKAEDFMVWMNKTRPQDWDITGILKAKRVLF